MNFDMKRVRDLQATYKYQKLDLEANESKPSNAGRKGVTGRKRLDAVTDFNNLKKQGKDSKSAAEEDPLLKTAKQFNDIEIAITLDCWKVMGRHI